MISTRCLFIWSNCVNTNYTVSIIGDAYAFFNVRMFVLT